MRTHRWTDRQADRQTDCRESCTVEYEAEIKKLRIVQELFTIVDDVLAFLADAAVAAAAAVAVALQLMSHVDVVLELEGKTGAVPKYL